MFKRYTDEAKRAIYFGHIEAVHRDERSISTRDLLIGLTWERGTRADKISALKEDAVARRAMLGIPHLPITTLPYMRKAEIPLDQEAKKTIAYAAKEADQDGQYWIDTDHLLRGLLRFPNAASGALAGVDLKSMRGASALLRESHPTAPTPGGAKFRAARKRYMILLLLLVILLVILANLRYCW